MIWLLHKMEMALLPSVDRLTWTGEGSATVQALSLRQKVQHYVASLFQLGLALVASPFVAVYSGVRSLCGRATPLRRPEPPAQPTPLPEHCGFSDSLFQTSGLGTKHSPTKLPGTCSWEKWLTPARIEGTDPQTDYTKFFTDVLGNPEPFIAELQKMGVTAYRFSLEWSVIEPVQGQRNEYALAAYKAFVDKLKLAGINPYVTLHHFVHPEWFESQGGFTNLQNVELFIAHASRMIDEFPQVRHWMTFNEPGVFGLQAYVRGVYPPGRTGDIATAGQVMRNLLYAHCKIYKEGKAKLHDVQIGITHQWLKFEPHSGNLLEQAICYFLSKITHYAVYNFFKTGEFALEIPFKANVRFSMPAELRNTKAVDFFGVQFYGFPQLKAGFNGGVKHPGYQVKNYMFLGTGLTFGATCAPGGKMQSFGPSFRPETLQGCLDEAWALERPIAITETGCDARIQKWGQPDFALDEETQAEYFRAMFPILERQNRKLQAFFAWTFWRGHLEWDRGDFPRLGMVTRRGADFELSPAAKVLQEHFAPAIKGADEKSA